MKRIVSHDVASKQRLSGMLQSCRAHSDLVNGNAKCPWAALQSAGAVSLDSSVHYEKNLKYYNIKVLAFLLQYTKQRDNGDDLSRSRLRGATHERSFVLVSAV